MAHATVQCVVGGGTCGACTYCVWAENGADIRTIEPNAAFTHTLFETKRMCAIMPAKATSIPNSIGAESAPCVRSVGAMRKKAKMSNPVRRAIDTDVGMYRLKRFMRLLLHLNTAPWANIVFHINERMIRRLVASHLHLIVGNDHFNSSNRSAMYHLIDANMKLDGMQNLVWVTNRQQGKTSTMGKFIAALSIASPAGGSLANVYSTSLDRANELTKAAKQYVVWMMTDEGRHPEWQTLHFVKNTYCMYTVKATRGGQENTVVSKPKNPDSCRGDAPHSAFFDEIGFMAEAFWYKFALPLLQVTARVCTCTTTPPPADSFFAVFVEKIVARNKEGDYFFMLENHSLACRECIELMEPDQCCHQLHFVPPWKSLLRFTQMRNLIPKRQLATFATEVYGVLHENNACYFPKPLVDAMANRARHTHAFVNKQTPCVWVGIDPAGHQRAEMAMVAMIISPDTSMCIILGVASIGVAQCEVSEVQALVRAFLARVREHVLVDRMYPLVPIVECNNNEVFAMSIVSSFAQFAPIWMPFTADRFRTNIVSGIGVITTHDNKQSMVTQVYQYMFEGRLILAHNPVTVCRSCIDGRARPIPVDETIEQLCEQLKRVRDHDDGTISGKSASGDNDDIAMAFMMLVYWSICVRATEPSAR